MVLGAVRIGESQNNHGSERQEKEGMAREELRRFGKERSASLEVYSLLLKPLHCGADAWASISAGTQRSRKRELYLQAEEALEDSNTAMRVRSKRVKSLGI